eukprot:COSAG02_NODE_38403_length_429_cov_1.018182_1_plen_75_part_01
MYRLRATVEFHSRMILIDLWASNFFTEALPEQVLYSRDLTMKLCDFAFSKWKQVGTEQVMSSAVGTPAWMAPEIL